MCKKQYSMRSIHVDLSSGKVWKEKVKEPLIRKFLGGRGLAAKILWDQIKPGIDPLGATNVLVFATGPLTGTNVPCSSRITISAKSPATNFYLKTNAGGHLAIALRMLECDVIVIYGQSDRPVYLWKDEHELELRDATPLWGKGVRETNTLLKEIHGKAIETACIGQAGERKIKFASIMVSYYNAAARGGIGAVMGSKNLKAIAARSGYGKVGVAHPSEFAEEVRTLREKVYSNSVAEGSYLYGTSGGIPWLNELAVLPAYNFKRSHIPPKEAEKISGQYLASQGYLRRRVGCGSCLYSCHRFSKVESGEYAGTESGGPEYETFSALGSGCGVVDTEAIIKANAICNDAGLDTISTGSAIQWLMETYEKGLVSERALRGLRPVWGDGRALVKLTEMIVNREGIGDILAEGVRAAAKKVGGDSWKWAVQTKGLEQSRVELRGAYGYALAFAVNPRGPDHLHTECISEFAATDQNIGLIERITGDKKYARPDILDKRAEIVRWHEDMFAVVDSLGLCASIFHEANREDQFAKVFQHATGIQMSPDELMTAGRRIVTLERCFNIREGYSREHDTLPWRTMHEEQEDLKNVRNMEDPVLTKEKLDGLLNEYYELHEWDGRTGKPLRTTLEKLGLEFVIKEFPSISGGSNERNYSDSGCINKST